MSKFSLFGGRFDHDPADSFYTDRDDAPECPFCRRPVERRRDGSLCCDDCEAEWDDEADLARSRKAVDAWPPEVDDES